MDGINVQLILGNKSAALKRSVWVGVGEGVSIGWFYLHWVCLTGDDNVKYYFLQQIVSWRPTAVIIIELSLFTYK